MFAFQMMDEAMDRLAKARRLDSPISEFKFVVNEHDATRRHFDINLSLGDFYLTWFVNGSLSKRAGAEMVADPETLRPIDQNKKATQRLLDLAYERGLIIYGRRVKGGVDGDNFMVAPPMIVTREQVGEIVSIIGDSLEVLAAELDLPVAGQG